MRTVLVCAAALSLAGCSLFDQKETSLEVSAQISPTSFRAGEKTTVTMTTTNKGLTTQSVPVSSCGLPFVIINSDGREISATVEAPLNCSLVAILKSLKPGESLVENFKWDGYAYPGPADGSYQLPPGKYTIRSYRNDDQVESHSADFQIVN